MRDIKDNAVIRVFCSPKGKVWFQISRAYGRGHYLEGDSRDPPHVRAMLSALKDIGENCNNNAGGAFV